MNKNAFQWDAWLPDGGGSAQWGDVHFPSVDRILDTCFWKHYLSATSFADGYYIIITLNCTRTFCWDFEVATEHVTWAVCFSIPYWVHAILILIMNNFSQVGFGLLS